MQRQQYHKLAGPLLGIGLQLLQGQVGVCPYTCVACDMGVRQCIQNTMTTQLRIADGTYRIWRIWLRLSFCLTLAHSSRRLGFEVAQGGQTSSAYGHATMVLQTKLSKYSEEGQR